MLVSVTGSREDASLVGKTFVCTRSSVSEGGLRLSTDQHIEPGTDLSLHVGIPGQSRPYVLEGIARWCQALTGEEEEEGDEAEEEDETQETNAAVGVELLDSSQDLDRWRAFVDELLLRRRVSS
jgi:hypothetical protein